MNNKKKAGEKPGSIEESESLRINQSHIVMNICGDKVRSPKPPMD